MLRGCVVVVGFYDNNATDLHKKFVFFVVVVVVLCGKICFLFEWVGGVEEWNCMYIVYEKEKI